MKRPALEKRRHKVVSVIVCDDIRRETSGKEILIGVYNNVAISGIFPIVFPQLFFRVAAEVVDPHPKTFTFQIEQESTGATVMNVTGNIPAKEDDDTSYLFGVSLQGFVANQPMTLLIRLGIDGDPDTVGKFVIRHPISDGERQRISV